MKHSLIRQIQWFAYFPQKKQKTKTKTKKQKKKQKQKNKKTKQNKKKKNKKKKNKTKNKNVAYLTVSQITVPRPWLLNIISKYFFFSIFLFKKKLRDITIIHMLKRIYKKGVK